MSLQLQKTHRFDTLDALRGVAALLVVQVHLPFLFAAHMPFPHAYLAVDFFFLLSGFVMSFAYGSRLREGWPTYKFLRDRIVRLYPLFLLSIPLGVLHLFVVSSKEHEPFPHSEVPLVLICTLLLLPLPGSLQTGGLSSYPVNGPSWSLFLEIVANLGHALFLRSRSLLQLSAIVVVANGLLIPLAILHNGIEVGFLKGQLPVGIVRVAASYSYGVLLFQLWKDGRLRLGGSAFASAGLLVAVLLSPVLHRGNGVADLLAVYILFPAVVVLGANSVVHPRVASLAGLMGTVSYAIYVLHLSVFTLFTGIWSFVLHSKPSDYAPVSGMVYVPVLLLVSYAADRFYDFPVRRYIRNRLAGAKPVLKEGEPEVAAR
jgi:peptidoglycan/LPS O-acetylase OafA/YrhL